MRGKVTQNFGSFAKENKKKATEIFSRTGRGREIRTPINGFGDHYSALKLFP